MAKLCNAPVGWGCSSAEYHLVNIHKALGSMSTSTIEKKTSKHKARPLRSQLLYCGYLVTPCVGKRPVSVLHYIANIKFDKHILRYLVSFKSSSNIVGFVV